MKEEYEKISKETLEEDCKFDIPEGATQFDFEVDTSSCWYESDTPKYVITFYKKKP